MIIDILENADRYLSLNRRMKEGFRFLMEPDLETLPAGMHEIYFDRVFAIVEEGKGRNKDEAELEAHEKYLDIQLVVSGQDSIGWKRVADCTKVSKAYDPDNDIKFFSDKPDVWLPVAPGTFVIFHPEDAHMPRISAGELKKVIVKIALDQ